jgi:tRNA-dihydrouridine synthase A
MKLALLHPAVTSAALVHAERFSVAPMVGHTHRHTRYFLRLLTQHSWLYTEMTHAEAVVDAERSRAGRPDADGSCAPLWRGPEPPGEHGPGPVALQLGGRESSVLAEAAAIGTRLGYDAINLNCGCPSGPVAGEWRQGAALMREPQLVAAACEAMQEASERAF